MKNFEIARINLYTILRDVLRNLWVIILAAMIGFFGARIYSRYIQKHEYVSSMTVSVNLSGYTQEATTLSLARTVVIADTLDDVLRSDAIRDVVKKDLGGDFTGTISSNRLGETNLISVSVTDSTPEKAYKTLVSVKNNYAKVTDYVFSNIIIRVVVNPQMPVGPTTSVSSGMFSLLMAMLCAMLVGGLTVFLSFMRDTVKNVSDIEDELEAKHFGTVYREPGSHANGAQSRLIVTNPNMSYGFVHSFQRMAVKLESLRRTKGIQSVMVTSMAGNEGKTSVSVNLACALAQNGHSVLLIDCDLRKPTVHYFFDDLPHPEGSDFYGCVTGGGNISSVIKRDEKTGLYVADNLEPYPKPAELLSGRRFAEMLQVLREQFDFIIVDTPPCGVGVDAEIISGVVDAAVMIVRQDFARVPDINDAIESIAKCEMIGCVFNNVAGFKSELLNAEGAAKPTKRTKQWG